MITPTLAFVKAPKPLSAQPSRNFSGAAKKFSLPALSYGYDALSPVISGKIMELHHSKHHNAYVTNLNAALEQYADAESKQDVGKMIALQAAIKFNGGGHINHSIFWTNLAPQKDGGGFVNPKLEIVQAITKKYGSIDNFVTKFNAQTVAVQGSGWGWLGFNKATQDVDIVTLPNQDPLSITGLIPLLGVDVWEHAYYLDYKNVRADYLKEVWKVVNWGNVEERFLAAKK
eukprot:TRINITY_DN2736_c0_g1_i1.p1 TRINITY_DN2736_c0_g1~~TRINITY_DN2736_c0_g1_i1.p1  ORF type:complete len:265 (-),score=108.44 TRINITY_DN2736_c0_g1_i1:22-711(-)